MTTTYTMQYIKPIQNNGVWEKDTEGNLHQKLKTENKKSCRLFKFELFT